MSETGATVEFDGRWVVVAVLLLSLLGGFLGASLFTLSRPVITVNVEKCKEPHND